MDRNLLVSSTPLPCSPSHAHDAPGGNPGFVRPLEGALRRTTPGVPGDWTADLPVGGRPRPPPQAR